MLGLVGMALLKMTRIEMLQLNLGLIPRGIAMPSSNKAVRQYECDSWWSMPVAKKEYTR